jgi:hypothetical protein
MNPANPAPAAQQHQKRIAAMRFRGLGLWEQLISLGETAGD